MRYMVFVKMADDVGAPPAELVETMGKEMGEAFASGWMRVRARARPTDRRGPPSGGRPVTTVPGGPEVFELPKSGVSVASFYTRPFYAWLNSWSKKNARPDVYKVFRDADSAQLQWVVVGYALELAAAVRGAEVLEGAGVVSFAAAKGAGRPLVAGRSGQGQSHEGSEDEALHY